MSPTVDPPFARARPTWLLLVFMKHSENGLPFSGETPWIILAEDSDEDYFLLHHAFRNNCDHVGLVRAKDGLEVIEWLRDAGARQPSVIVTDLKMPTMNGYALLSWLALRPGMDAIPAVVLSGYNEPFERERSHNLGARLFLAKTCDAIELQKLAGFICRSFLPKDFVAACQQSKEKSLREHYPPARVFPFI